MNAPPRRPARAIQRQNRKREANVVITDIRITRVATATAAHMLLGGGWLFVEVQTDDGLVGLGEASQAGDDLVATCIEKRLGPELRGKDPRGIEPLTTEMLAKAEGRAAATAVSAIEQALWDIWGQSLGQPIWALLGGRYCDRIPLYANINRAPFDRSPAGFAAAARGAVADGFRAVKCAPFDGVTYRYPDRTANRPGIAAGIARVAAIREAVGPEVRLMVDCHSRFDAPTAIEVARELAPLRLDWIEEPLPDHDLDGLERVREHCSIPLAGAEALVGRVGYWETLRRRVLDVIMPDVKHCGGLLELRKIAALAETTRVSVSPHNPSGPVSTLASVHVCATIPNLLALEYPWGETSWRGGLLRPAEIIEDGSIAVPERPGLGFRLDPDVVRAHRV
jgi:galactonate dehydratase